MDLGIVDRKIAGQSAGIRSAAYKPLSDTAMTRTLHRLKVGATVHGFRSTFRDGCSEETDFPSKVAEMALAHAIENKFEPAYRRGKLLEKRRELMDTWARFALGDKR